MSKVNVANATINRPGRRGGFGVPPLAPSELRTHSVQVLLNDDELNQLDPARLELSRAAYLRSATIGKLRPQPVPETTRQALFILSKVAGNLSTLAVSARAGEFIEEEHILLRIREFRDALFVNFEVVGEVE